MRRHENADCRVAWPKRRRKERWKPHGPGAEAGAGEQGRGSRQQGAGSYDFKRRKSDAANPRRQTRTLGRFMQRQASSCSASNNQTGRGLREHPQRRGNGQYYGLQSHGILPMAITDGGWAGGCLPSQSSHDPSETLWRPSRLFSLLNPSDFEANDTPAKVDSAMLSGVPPASQVAQCAPKAPVRTMSPGARLCCACVLGESAPMMPEFGARRGLHRLRGHVKCWSSTRAVACASSCRRLASWWWVCDR